MASHTLEVQDLYVQIKNKQIIRGISFKIETNEVVALVGPNGHGKSCLLLTIIGHPKYQIAQGDILLDGKSIKNMPANERSRLGLFLAFQNPPEIVGVSNLDYYRNIIKNDELKRLVPFYKEVHKNLELVGLPEETTNRELNVGFSGGEKKRHELMQMQILKPNFVLLDEIDSGLDVDAINIVADIINMNKETTGQLVISHYSRLYDMIKPTRAIVLVDGRIVHDGGTDVLHEIDKGGYADFTKRRGISLERTSGNNQELLGVCATKTSKK